jgi:hypothetical protein
VIFALWIGYALKRDARRLWLANQDIMEAVQTETMMRIRSNRWDAMAGETGHQKASQTEMINSVPTTIV